jgi:excisionase family DNA binding protein
MYRVSKEPTIVRNEALLDVRGAAESLGCTERYIRRLVQERRIPFLKIGGSKIRFVVSDLDTWVEEQRVTSRN